MQPLVGVTADRKTTGDHPVHSVGEKYITCIAKAAGCVPVLIPALGGTVTAEAQLDHLDGLFLTGSPSNVEPHHYDGLPLAEDENDPARDATALPMIKGAIARGIPLFAVCRGIQELNVALGGTLHQQVQELDGTLDHRMRRDTDSFDRKYRYAHPIDLVPGGLLADLLGGDPVLVNSLHQQAIDQVAEDLAIEALAPDGIIEAVSVKSAKAFALGVQWHPEHPSLEDPVSKALFNAFGDACRAYANRRLAA